jgi:uncharacterized OB-fold protein
MTMWQRRPNRTLGVPHDQFWEFCNHRELRLQRCDSCSNFAWPPVERCRNGDDGQLTWQAAEGTGHLVSWATFEHQYHPEVLPPWDTILVELDEGPLFVSNPFGFGWKDMEPALPVEVDFVDCEDDAGRFLLPVFRRQAPR